MIFQILEFSYSLMSQNSALMDKPPLTHKNIMRWKSKSVPSWLRLKKKSKLLMWNIKHMFVGWRNRNTVPRPFKSTPAFITQHRNLNPLLLSFCPHLACSGTISVDSAHTQTRHVVKKLKINRLNATQNLSLDLKRWPKDFPHVREVKTDYRLALFTYNSWDSTFNKLFVCKLPDKWVRPWIKMMAPF